MATILGFRTSTYAMNIYRFGTNRLTARDGYVGVADGYYTPVEQYAATHYGVDEIDKAYTEGWISAEEHNETISYVPQPVIPTEPTTTP